MTLLISYLFFGQIFTLGSWRKQKTVGALCSSDDEFLEFADSPDAASSSSRGKSSKQKGSGRKRIEDVFPVKVPHRAPAEGSPSLPAPLELRRRLVDLDGLRAGMFRFRFLLNGTQPGSVPDPKIVASMLDLVRAFVTTILVKIMWDTLVECTVSTIDQFFTWKQTFFTGRAGGFAGVPAAGVRAPRAPL